jgi:hypothetical protein
MMGQTSNKVCQTGLVLLNQVLKLQHIFEKQRYLQIWGGGVQDGDRSHPSIEDSSGSLDIVLNPHKMCLCAC